MRPTPPLERAVRRLRLTTKQAGRGYYKGNRTGSMGWHTKHGAYKIDYRKVRTYVAPALNDDHGFTPFVSNRFIPPTYFSTLDARPAMQVEEDTALKSELEYANWIAERPDLYTFDRLDPAGHAFQEQWGRYRSGRDALSTGDEQQQQQQHQQQLSESEPVAEDEVDVQGATEDVVAEPSDPDGLTVEGADGLRRPNWKWYPLRGQGYLLEVRKREG